MSKTLVQIISDTLKARKGERLTGNQLATTIVRENEKWAEQKKQKSKNPIIKDGGFDEMKAQVQSEIGSNRPAIEKHPHLRMTEDKPRRYYFTELSDEEEIFAVENEPPGNTEGAYSEHDLYPILAKYLLESHAILGKRIDEKKSKNSQGKKGNQWLHPDLIGFQVLSEKWGQTITALVQARSDASSRLWSFEVKKLVNRSNLREVFFQTLSNSAWANFAYLVAAEISGKGTLDELRMLAGQHGVGVIILSTDPETESTIEIQARERVEVDWTAANRLAVENPDAKSVFEQVRIFHQAGSLNRDFWAK